MKALHTYETVVTWTGNRGTGTSGFRDFGRDHDVAAPPAAVTIPGSADPAYRGDPTRWNPEQMLVAALSQCHMLWYLTLCSEAGVVVTDYVDRASGTMSPAAGVFTEVILRPRVAVATPDMAGPALALHDNAGKACFIARSVTFPVRCEPRIDSVTVL